MEEVGGPYPKFTYDFNKNVENYFRDGDYNFCSPRACSTLAILAIYEARVKRLKLLGLVNDILKATGETPKTLKRRVLVAGPDCDSLRGLKKLDRHEKLKLYLDTRDWFDEAVPLLNEKLLPAFNRSTAKLREELDKKGWWRKLKEKVSQEELARKD